MTYKDKYVYVNHRSTVNEHRAPTDESIKILNEMQEKAKDNIIKSIKIEENYLKAVGIYTQQDSINRDLSYCLRFILNGKEYLIKDEIKGDDLNNILSEKFYALGHEGVYIKLHKVFSNAIAEHLLKNSRLDIDGL